MDEYLPSTGREITTEVKSKDIVKFEKGEPKIDLSILRKKSSAKTASGIVLGYLKKLKNIPLDYKIMLQEMYKEIKNLEVSEKIVLEGWKKKSSLQIIEKPDYFIVITFQKKDQDSKPEEVKTEITKEEVNLIIKTISELNKGEKISTRSIGERAYKKKWDDIFSDRKISDYGNHIKLNLILRLLDYYGVTHYRGRFSKVLKNILDINSVVTVK